LSWLLIFSLGSGVLAQDEQKLPDPKVPLEQLPRIVDRQVAAGTYKVNWDASRLAYGFYLYRLEAEGFAQTKKLLLMK